MRFVAAETMPSPRTLFWSSVFMGFLVSFPALAGRSYVLCGLGKGLPGPPRAPDLASVIACAGLLFAAAVIVLLAPGAIGTYRRAWMSGLGYGIGLVALWWLQLLLGSAPVYEKVIPIGVVIVCGLVSVGAWTLLMRTTYAVRIVDDDECARCGYDLSGTPERCPECGHVVETL